MLDINLHGLHCSPARFSTAPGDANCWCHSELVLSAFRKFQQGSHQFCLSAVLLSHVLPGRGSCCWTCLSKARLSKPH